MRWERRIFEIQYHVFDVGERVTPTSPRCPLDPGIYTVTKYHKPMNEGDEAVVFVEGHATGVNGYYLTSVDHPDKKPDDYTLVEKLQAYINQLEQQKAELLDFQRANVSGIGQSAIDAWEATINDLKTMLSTVV